MNKIVPVIMCGGVGSRLWPVSRENHPKQFLKIDGEHSLLQKTILRTMGDPCFSKPIILCNDAHKFKIASEMQDINCEPYAIITEPEQKNTANAIALAACYIAKNIDCNHRMLVMPADHVIKEESVFVEKIKEAAEKIKNQVVVFGIKPIFNSTDYGYIKKGEISDSGMYKVEKFVEKPNADTAKIYLESHSFYWNAGIFLFKAETYLKEMELYLSENYLYSLSSMEKSTKSFDFIQPEKEIFAKCTDISIDYGILERSSNVDVYILDITWHDLGTWRSVYEYFNKDENNNVVIGDHITSSKTKDCLVYANCDKNVVLHNVQNLSVIATEDAVLVVDKNSTADVKKIYQNFQVQNNDIIKTSKQNYRPWGFYKNLLVSENYRVKIISLKPYAKISLQYHYKRAEHWVITKGVAHVTKGRSQFILNQDESVYIPKKEIHMIENKSDSVLTFIEVQVGSYVGEDDIVRLEDAYGRV